MNSYQSEAVEWNINDHHFHNQRMKINKGREKVLGHLRINLPGATWKVLFVKVYYNRILSNTKRYSFTFFEGEVGGVRRGGNIFEWTSGIVSTDNIGSFNWLQNVSESSQLNFLTHFCCDYLLK